MKKMKTERAKNKVFKPQGAKMYLTQKKKKEARHCKNKVKFIFSPYNFILFEFSS
jgi:hypothetical protein